MNEHFKIKKIMEKYKFKITESKVGELDRHFVDNTGAKIASLLREPNNTGFTIIPYFECDNDKTNRVDTLVEAYLAIRSLLKKIGIDAEFYVVCGFLVI